METKGIITSEMPLDFIKPRDYLDSTEFEIIPLDHLRTHHSTKVMPGFMDIIQVTIAIPVFGQNTDLKIILHLLFRNQHGLIFRATRTFIVLGTRRKTFFYFFHIGTYISYIIIWLRVKRSQLLVF